MDETPTITDLLRELCRDLKKRGSWRQVGAQLDIEPMALLRFVEGTGLHSDSCDKIAKYFRLSLYQDPEPKEGEES